MNYPSAIPLVCAMCLFTAGTADRALARDMPAPGPGTPAVSKALSGGVALEARKSGFAGEERGRNPFWPVAWVPGAPEAKPVEPELNPGDYFKISSILLGQLNLAVINGRSYEAGEVISTDAGGKTLKFQVKEIQDGSVTLTREGKTYELKQKLSTDGVGQRR